MPAAPVDLVPAPADPTGPATGPRDRGRRMAGPAAALLAVAVLAAAGVTAFGLATQTSSAAAAEEVAASAAPATELSRLLSPAEMIEVEAMQLRDIARLSGDIRPLRRALVSVEVGGIVAEVGPRPGDYVAEGSLLLRLEDGDLRRALAAEEAALAALLAELQVSRAAFDRAGDLADRGAGTALALEQARGALHMLEAQQAGAESRVDLARANLDRARLTAPFAGHVVSRNAEPGELIAAGTGAFEIIDLSVVTVMALVPMAEAAQLQPGQPARFWFPQAPDRRFTAELMRIGAEAEADSRAVPVWFEIDNRQPGLRAGGLLVGEVTLRSWPDALALPGSALRVDGATTSVMTVRDGRAVLTPVAAAETWQGGLVRIASGLSAGDQVVALPLSGLAAGDAVRIEEQ